MDENKAASDFNPEQWVTDFGDDLYSWARYKTGSVEMAEDLVQETFLAAWKNRNSFRQKSHPKTWLFAILRNKITDYYRKSAGKEYSFSNAQTDEVLSSNFDEHGNWSPTGYEETWKEEGHLLDDPEFLKVLNFCLQQLPGRWMHAINFAYFSEKKSAEICQELEITASNYWQILHRSKLKLKKCIEGKWLS